MAFEQLDDDEHVFSTEESGIILSRFHPNKVQITSRLPKVLCDYLVTSGFLSNSCWTAEGVDGRLLKIGGSGWVQGKLRFKIVLEFCPDKPEPPSTDEIAELKDFPL